MQKLFIIATDTDAGKTYIATNLIKAFERQNIKSLCLKPVASGKSNNTDICDDVAEIIKAYDDNSKPNDINLVSFREAIAPHIAANIYNKQISLPELSIFITKKYTDNLDIMMIEGAGGLFTPYSNSTTQLDLITALEMPVLLVVNIKVGCINHALLTINELRRANIKCRGWVANCYLDVRFPDEQISTIESLSGLKCLKKVIKNESQSSFDGLALRLISPDENV